MPRVFCNSKVAALEQDGAVPSIRLGTLHGTAITDAAVSWLLGEATILPTIANAARIFGRCRNHIAGAVARRRAETSPPRDLLTEAWTEATPLQRERFTRANFADIDAAIDRATAPARSNGASLHS